MRFDPTVTILLASLLSAPAGAQSPAASNSQAEFCDSAPAPQVRQAPAIRPLNGFVENKGQWPDEVLFFARYGRIDLTILPDALVFRPTPDRETGEWPAPLVLRLPHAAGATGEGALPTQHNFLIGAIRVSHASGFERVVYHDVMPGLDLAVHVGAQGFEYDLNAGPGIDISAFALQVEGASGLTIEDGALVMQTAAGRVEQRIGAAWQTDASGAQAPAASRFNVLPAASNGLRFGFEAPGRDSSQAFVLDPSLVFATYVGGAGQETLADMAVDPAGATYLTCRSSSPSPTTPGSVQPTFGGAADVWVGKLLPSGAGLAWATYVGGNLTEQPIGIDVDLDGTVVVAGQTSSTNFPTTPNTVEPVNPGVPNIPAFFATRLSADGSSIVWSTYYGGASGKEIKASGLLPSGDVLLAGQSDTASPPATPGAFDTDWQSGKQLIARISADGSHLVWQTYFKSSSVADIAFDSQSNIYFSGQVFAADAPLPATPGALKTQMPPGQEAEAYVAKLDPTGSHLIWATYLGGDEGSDSAIALAVDAASAVYVAGLTDSNDFPVSPGAFSTTLTVTSSGFVTKLLPDASGLVWSTYLGATAPGGTSLLFDISVDTAGNAIAVGFSNVAGFPTTPDAFQSVFKGPTPSADCHITKLDAFGETLVYSTWFGGNSSDFLSKVGLDALQQPCLAFMSGSTDISTTPGAYDNSYAGGGGDTVVAKFSLPLAPWTVLGDGLKGTADVPNLAGAGVLTAGSIARLSLRGAKPSVFAALVAGITEINAPFKGGTLVPAPDVLVPLATDSSGGFDVSFAWPALPAGIQLTMQSWASDSGAVHGWSASNALRLISK